jgi:RNA 2',3'-cyclic 3'-phosphodiesterase
VADGEQRLFVAVPLPPEAVADCSALIDGVRSGPLGRVPRWVHVPNLHLTVRFLGATPDPQVEAVAAAVDAALAGMPAFDVELAGAGAFPNGHKPRTLWLGIRRGADELGAMARALDGALAPLGWPPEERAYRPHLTVARLDAAPRSDGVAVARALDDAAMGWHTAFRAREAVLFRSQLGGGAPRHERVLEHALAGA